MPLSESSRQLPDPHELARTIAENSVHGLVMMDENGWCIYANQAWLDMTGFSQEEMRSKTVHDLVHHHYPDGRPFPIEECPVGCTLGQNRKVRNHHDIFFRRDGTPFPVCCSASPIVKDGAPVLMILETRDTSEENFARQRLRVSDARFHTMTDVMPQMAWAARPDGFITYCNRRWYEFTGMQEGSGNDWQDLLHPDDIEHCRATWSRSLATGEPYETQHRMRHHTGEYRWVLVQARPIRNEYGTIVEWMGTNTDIQEQKLTEEKLKKSNRQKDDFLAMLAHELRNPLAPISTAAQILRMDGIDSNRIRSTSDIILRQVKHMTELVNDLLDVSRVTRGLVDLNKEYVDIRTVVANAVEQARPFIDAKNHELAVQMAPRSSLVFGDRTRLVQVVANLLNNAAKYTLPTGHIRLTVRDTGAAVRIDVADDGIGIEPALLPTIFDLFIQGHRSPDRSQGGLGLGLTLVKTIVNLHDGKVEAYSAGPGMGSAFTVTLPTVLPAAATMAADAPASRHALPRTKRRRILIVDDNVDAVTSIATLLEAEGHDVSTAENAFGAHELASREIFDTYILDIGLPDINGYELAQAFRRRAGNEDALFIALTGYGQPHDRLQSASAGFAHHFVKPVEIQHLLEALL